jgi:flavin-binding protein dodecin
VIALAGAGRDLDYSTADTRRSVMAGTVARVTEISATSDTSFEDAIKIGLQRATQTLRGVKSGWVKEQEVQVGQDGNISGYKVNLLITFVLD